MRKLISLLCAVALVISLAPNPRLALANNGGGGGGGGGAGDLFIMGRTAFDFLVVALLIGSVQQLMMIQLSLFAAPIQQKSKKAKQNWSSSASSSDDTDDEQKVFDLPSNMSSVGGLYRLDNRLYVHPQITEDTDNPGLDRLSNGEGGFGIHLIERVDKDNAQAFTADWSRIDGSFDSKDAGLHFQEGYDRFQTNMDEAEHVGDLQIGYREEGDVVVIEIRHEVRF